MKHRRQRDAAAIARWRSKLSHVRAWSASLYFSGADRDHSDQISKPLAPHPASWIAIPTRSQSSGVQRVYGRARNVAALLHEHSRRSQRLCEACRDVGVWLADFRPEIRRRFPELRLKVIGQISLDVSVSSPILQPQWSSANMRAPLIYVSSYVKRWRCHGVPRVYLVQYIQPFACTAGNCRRMSSASRNIGATRARSLRSQFAAKVPYLSTRSCRVASSLAPSISIITSPERAPVAIPMFALGHCCHHVSI